jgi:dTDP-4-dehydrorhamnose reductase
MLGSALVPCLEPDHIVKGVDLRDFDIRDGSATERVLLDLRPDLVIHLAAYTDVDGCEEHPQRAEETNALGTWHMARACAQIGAVLLYVSTDYVFDGRLDRPYREDDCPHPINVYGQTKFRGEQHVQALVRRHFIVRSSWLYGPQGKNFVATILRMAKGHEELRVVSDRCGSPTYTHHLAGKLTQLLRVNEYGVYHITGAGECSWLEFARAIVELADQRPVRVVPITSQELGRRARRPANSLLENRRLLESHLGALPHWSEGLRQYLAEVRQAGGIGVQELNPVTGLPQSEATEI